MAVSAKQFGPHQLGLYSATADRRVDWLNDTIKVTLHTVTYVPNQDTHDFFDDATNELATAGGYTAGGVTLAGKTLTYDAASNEVRLDANDVSWTNATFTARYAVIWKDTAGAASTDPLIGYVDFGADQSPAGITFTIAWDATSGVLRTTVA